MEVSEILAMAQAEVDKARIAAPLKPIAFEKAVDLIVASGGLPVGKGAAPSSGGGGGSGGGGAQPDGTLLGQVLARLKVDLGTEEPPTEQVT